MWDCRVPRGGDGGRNGDAAGRARTSRAGVGQHRTAAFQEAIGALCGRRDRVVAGPRQPPEAGRGRTLRTSRRKLTTEDNEFTESKIEKKGQYIYVTLDLCFCLLCDLCVLCGELFLASWR